MSTRLNKPGKWLRTELPVTRFSREWFMQSLRTAAWVAVITVLVWVYADIHFTDKEYITAILHFHTNSDSKVVLLSESRIPITFRIKGNRYYMDRFINRLAGVNSILEFDVAGAKEYKPGQKYQERTANLMSKLAAFRGSGLEIISARPARIDIHMDNTLLVPDVQVEFKYSGAVLAEDPRIEPARIELRLPASLRQKIDPKKITLMTRTVDLSGKAAGKTETVKVVVLPPSNLNHVKLKPRKVTVTFKVGQQTDSRKFTVTVAVQSPKAWLMDGTGSKYELQTPPPENWTRQITVAGNRIDLDKLSAENIQAYIVLTDNDLKPVKSWWPGKVKVRFPEGLKVSLAEPAPEDLMYRLVKRGEAPAPPGS